MTHKKERPFYPPPSIPPAWGGKIKLLPLDGGGPGGGEKRWEIFILFLGYISVKFYNIIYLSKYLITI
jgi:hypothetical protein